MEHYSTSGFITAAAIAAAVADQPAGWEDVFVDGCSADAEEAGAASP